MKYTFHAIIILTVVFLTSVFSCNKKKAEETYSASQLNKYFAGFRSTPENISVQAGRDTVVFGSGGTMLHFYTNSFKDAAGNVISSGSIGIQLIEMYTPKDMISNRTSTVADNMPLQSGGQVNIVAMRNGVKVFANVYGIGFKQADNSGPQMELYYQSGNNSDSSITWTMADTTGKGTTASTVTEYPPQGFYYIFDSCTSFDFINCDHPARDKWGNGAQYTIVHVILSDHSFDNNNTQVYFVFPSINCSEQLFFYEASTNAFGGYDPKPSFPVGEPYKIVVMGFKDDRYYYAEKSGTITSNMDVTMTPTQETLGDIKARLGGI